MTDEERKKVALRFLKETGLFLMWRRYIQDCLEKKHGAFCNWNIRKDNWHKKEYISGSSFNQPFEEYKIFGNTCFTDYLLRNGVLIHNSFFCYYARYITEKGYVPKGKWSDSKYTSKEELLNMFPNVEL
jgi:hypothetical protein